MSTSNEFPRIPGPKPLNWDTFTPEQRDCWHNEEMRGMHMIPCPHCKRLSNGQIRRCHDHRLRR